MRIRLSFASCLVLAAVAACSEGAPATEDEPQTPKTETTATRAAPDAHGVRYAGGETGDFGDGSQQVCDKGVQRRVVTESEAEALGFDLATEAKPLIRTQTLPLRLASADCEDASGCDGELQISSEVVEWVLVERESAESTGCSLPERHLDCLLAVHLDTLDGRLEGSFYMNIKLVQTPLSTARMGHVYSDLRNFTGSWPLNLDLSRAQFAFLETRLVHEPDENVSGSWVPAVHYFGNGSGPAIGQEIGAPAWFGQSELEFSFDIWESRSTHGTDTTLEAYLGSPETPTANIQVRADAVEPQVDTEVEVRIDGKRVQQETLPAGTLLELGALPYGTTVDLNVKNANDAGMVRAHILQDNCFVASKNCAKAKCEANLAYTVGFQRCVE